MREEETDRFKEETDRARERKIQRKESGEEEERQILILDALSDVFVRQVANPKIIGWDKDLMLNRESSGLTRFGG